LSGARYNLRHRDGRRSSEEIPGTVVFTGEQCRKGHSINKFCENAREVYRYYHGPVSNTALGHMIIAE
jgi:hypothetical protein